MRIGHKNVAALWKKMNDRDSGMRKRAYLAIISECLSHNEIVWIVKHALDRVESEQV